MDDCIFCKIVKKEIPSKPLYEDDLCYAFYDLDPKAPVHFLVIPKKHIKSAIEINEDNDAIIGHCYTVIAKVMKELGYSEYRVVTNCGKSATQTVFHFHLHCMAGREFGWPEG